MSRLSDFFSSSNTSSTTTTTPTEDNAWVLLVGGGGGGGAGMVNVCTGTTIRENIGFGGGGGGVYVGGFQICPGVSYPVVVGAGGACGCLKDECAGEPGGAGASGGISRFGNCIVMGGGGAGTFCWCATSLPSGYENGMCDGKIVPNKHGANSGNMQRMPTDFTGIFLNRNINGYQLTRSGIDGFRADSATAGGGGMQTFYTGPFSPPSVPDFRLRSQKVENSVGDGFIVECNPTNDSWELKSTFFGLKLIPDAVNSTCPNRVMYCCNPTTIPPGTNPNPQGGDNLAFCYGFSNGYIPAGHYQLGVSRNSERCAFGSPCFCGQYAQNFSFYGCPFLMQVHIPNTGIGGLNQLCPGHPDYPKVNNPRSSAPAPFFFSATGGDGVVYVVYDYDLGAASSTPGAVDCTPVTGPQGYRSYRYTSSGSFTL